jgi:autotransporter adhesin
LRRLACLDKHNLQSAESIHTDAMNVAQLNQISTNQAEARSVIALALASGALQFDQRRGKLSIAAAVGNFKAQSALVSDLGYAVNGQWRMNASFSAAPQNNDYGVAIGSSWTLN